MIKFKIPRTKELARAITEVMPSILDPDNMRKYAQMGADMVRLRTRLGSGVARDGADKAPLKPLAESTKARREAMQASGRLSSLTSPGKSNLTATGQMLESITVTEVRYGAASVGPSGSRDDGKSNAEVAEHVTDAGRPFNNLSRVETKRLLDAVRRDIRNAAKKLLTTQ